MKSSPVKRGFTIVELIVVIVGLGILAAIVSVSHNANQRRAANAEVQSDMRRAAIMLEQYKGRVGAYPENQSQVNDGKGLPGTDSEVGRTYAYSSDDYSYCLATTVERTGASFRVTSENNSRIVEVPTAQCP